jgi:acetyl esterase/lipase
MKRDHGWIPLSPIILLGFIFSAISIVDAQRQDPNIEIERDIVYSTVNDIELKLDLYRPKREEKTPLPTIVCIHGGGWKSGDKSQMKNVLTFAQRGYVSASINYRLSGVAPFPAAAEDCKTAVRWLRANAEKYGIDTNRIGGFGTSAGGHLVLLLAYADKSAGLEGSGNENVSSQLQAVCSWFGPTDFTVGHQQFQNGTGEGPLKFLGGKTMEEAPDVYKRASPLTYVTKSAPPTLMIHGDSDQTVPFSQSETLFKHLQDLGVDCSLIKVNNAGHGFKPVDGKSIEPSMEEIFQKTNEFFDKQLKKSKS